MSSDTRKKTLRIAAFAVVAIVIVAGVGFGVHYAWQVSRGPTQASKEDCELAQQLYDRAKQVPSDPAQAQALEVELRKIRYEQFENDGISTEVGRFIMWQVNEVTGGAPNPSRADYDDMVSNAQGHCRGELVLNIPRYDY
ncbi:hypothetical protein SAMN05216188_110268 [Lentzea xinjiangensis]|uniref:Uncharacterized protein n=1 Tax=Lentzea xinjiangensis TaxID=402600 RepID=A0A1H9NL51_9PSEU|nr:hypothetical protein [Lentzea xinjiangensis]SER36622.1 hypothetical protein SAMN05216188_110268 [Lentzea xinjiangensis]